MTTLEQEFAEIHLRIVQRFQCLLGYIIVVAINRILIEKRAELITIEQIGRFVTANSGTDLNRGHERRLML